MNIKDWWKKRKAAQADQEDVEQVIQAMLERGELTQEQADFWRANPPKHISRPVK